jgi:hypothetical protein
MTEAWWSLAERLEIWTRSTDAAVVDHGGRVVVLDLRTLESARPLVLEGPAAAIWHALSQPRTAEQVSSAVAADFGLPATEVEADVIAFLSTLRERGLASVRPIP